MRLITICFLVSISLNAHSQSKYINSIPDFTQTQVKGAQSGNGQQYCGPVAVSNSLYWLGVNNLSQIDLIKKLASKPYMKTSLKNGTGTGGILRGVSKLIKETVGEYKELTYQGWRKHPRKYSHGIEVPELNWIKRGVSNRSAVWLNVGWYTFNKNKAEYKRVGGHWVTLVGYEGNTLIIHDPSPRAGKFFSNEYVQLLTIAGGTLVGNKRGLPRSAAGYHKLGGGMHIKSSAEYAILDGAVLLRL